MKHVFFILILCGFALSLGAQSGIQGGVVQVKLNEAAAQRLQQAAKPLSAAAGPLSVGISTIDAVNTRHKVRKMKPVFTIGGPFEERQRRYGLHLWYEITFEESTAADAVAVDYLQTGDVEIAEPVYAIRLVGETPLPAAVSSDDPMFNQQWHYNNTGQTPGGVAGMDIRLREAWELTKGDPKVIVSVVDGGIDYNHPDLQKNWSGLGRNFVSGTSGELSKHMHGTHVAGTIAASSNNAAGVAGIAGGWGSDKGVQLMSCQIFDTNLPDAAAATADAIRYGADNGAVISQNSWGYENPGVSNQSVRTAINYFIDNAGKNNTGQALPGTPMKGGIVIFAAGNDNSDRADWYPGMWPEVLCVAAIGPTGRRAYYSNYGTAIDITAPGGDMSISNNSGVLSTTPDNSYLFQQGTSMACPHVSGVAALLLSRLGSTTYTPEMLRERLLLSAQPIPTEPLYAEGLMGAGLIDASRAVLDYAAVTGVNLPPATNVQMGRTTAIAVTIIPSTATNNHIIWQTADNAIASVNQFGVISGHALGTTTVSATTEQGGYTATTTVTVLPVAVENINVSPKDVELKIGEMQVLNANISPTDASDKNIQWSSNNPAVAMVNNSGVLTAIGIGTTEIVATTNDGNYTDNCMVTVRQPVTGVEITPMAISMVSGDTLMLTATVIPDNAYDKQVFFNSSNSNIVSVDANTGKIQARKAGEARVTVLTNDGQYPAVCTVTVYESVHAPQGFSPNGDGLNDYFVCTLDSRDSYNLIVFDRSGQVHYRSSDYRNDWNGEANTGPHAGNKVPVNTYFYTLSAKRSGQVTTGFVVIKY
jgi:gliding motility-associated-like protein